MTNSKPAQTAKEDERNMCENTISVNPNMTGCYSAALGGGHGDSVRSTCTRRCQPNCAPTKNDAGKLGGRLVPR